jgi:hypothetical protein
MRPDGNLGRPDGQLFLCLKRNYETSRILESVRTLYLFVQTLGLMDIQVITFFVSFPTTPILSQYDT